jgi:Ca2+-binding RTX toxin-like protein
MESKPHRRTLLVVIAAVASLVLPTTDIRAGGFLSCTNDTVFFVAGVLTITGEADCDDNDGIEVEAATGNILFNGDPITGTPTVNNTTTINYDGGTDINSDRFSILLEGGYFAPGLDGPSEVTGLPEIEINVTAELATVTAADGKDVWRGGSNGMNLNGDDDVDVTFSGVEEFFFDVEKGADIINMNGDAVTGGPVSAPVIVEAGPGNDKIVGGDGDDDFFGSSGADKLIGKAGNDRGRGGSGVDRCKTEEKVSC